MRAAYQILVIVASANCALAAQEPVKLSDAVSAALDWHPSVARASAELVAATERIAVAGSGRWPSFSVSGSAMRFQEPMVIRPLHRFDPANPPEFDRTLINGDLEAEYLLFDPERGARIDRARALGSLSDQRLSEATQSLILGVVVEYLTTLSSMQVVEAHDRRIRALEAERDRVELALAAEVAARVELLRVQAELARARADREGAAGRLEVSLAALARLTGLDSDLWAERVSPESIRTDPESPPPTVDQAVTSSPRVRQARAAVAAAEAEAGLARSAWYPRVGLNAGYVGYGGGGSNLTAEWQAGVRVSYPIFTGGRRSAEVAAASAEAESARQRLREVELEVRGAAESVLATWRETHARIASLEEAAQHSSEVARIELLTLAAGAGTQTDYLDAEARVVEVAAELIRARYRAIELWATMAFLSGDMSEEWVIRHLEDRNE